MFKLPKWALPNNYPAFYDTESATAIEMTAKLYGAMSSFADEYNKFADDVNKVIEEFVAKGAEDYLVFQMKMEQLYSDFVKVVELKYQSQDVYLQGAVAQIIAELPVKLEETINNMYTSGEFDELVYNSVANLKTDFDRIVANNNTFQSNINKSFSNLVTDMESFKQSTTTDFNELSAALNAKFDELVLDAQSADMQKAIYDKNNSGVVDDAEKLGGQLPAYYAKQQDLDTTNANMETLNISVNSTISQIETAQNTATSAKNTADAAKTSADSALSKVNAKLGVNETAADSSKLGGVPAADYALSADAINTYTHAKTGIIHYLNGSGNNIKFNATADFAAGDKFYVNGTEVAACFQNGDELSAGYFKSGHVVSCFLNGDTLNFKSGGAGVKIEDITVYTGSNYPASPKENDVFIPSDNSSAYIYSAGNWNEITLEKLERIILEGSNYYTDITGGWTKTWGNSFSYVDEGIKIAVGASWGTYIETIKSIDLTGYNKATFTAALNITGSYATKRVGVGNNYVDLANVTGNQTIEVDISEMTSGAMKAQVVAGNDVTGASAYMILKKIVLS